MSIIKVDAKGITRPAELLAEKVAEATGGLFRPWQIRRVAKAEAEARVVGAEAEAEARLIEARAEAAAGLISAHGEVEIEDLRRRAIERFIGEEMRRQLNIESITAKAQSMLAPGAAVDQLEVDWVSLLFEHGRIVTDDEMQTLWARVLSGQANQPGSFSRKTLSSLATLERTDAEAFSRVARFVLRDETGPEKHALFIYLEDDNFFYATGVSFAELLHLSSIGLITLTADSYTLALTPGENRYSYVDSSITITRGNRRSNVNAGNALLTQVGEQLLQACRPLPVPGFLDLLSRLWSNQGHEVSIASPSNEGSA